MNSVKPQKLQFNVSSGLKSVLGGELITDDEVAIFELVKNSFDAGARRVDLFFDHEKLVVADNGCGMSYDDIRNKWLSEAEKRFVELRHAEEAALQQADEERKAKEAAQTRAAAAEQNFAIATEKLVEEKKRNHFLSSIATLDTDTILNLHHQVTIYAVDIQQQIENFGTSRNRVGSC